MNWRDKVLADLEAGCKAFGAIEPRRAGPAEPEPDRGVGVRPDGGVTLAVTDKVIVVKDLDRELPRDAIGPTVLDGVSLTPQEWAGFAPPEKAEGSRWDVPEAVARSALPRPVALRFDVPLPRRGDGRPAVGDRGKRPGRGRATWPSRAASRGCITAPRTRPARGRSVERGGLLGGVGAMTSGPGRCCR